MCYELGSISHFLVLYIYAVTQSLRPLRLETRSLKTISDHGRRRLGWGKG